MGYSLCKLSFFHMCIFINSQMHTPKMNQPPTLSFLGDYIVSDSYSRKPSYNTHTYRISLVSNLSSLSFEQLFQTVSFIQFQNSIFLGLSCITTEFIVCSALILVLTGYEPQHGVHQKDSICKLRQWDIYPQQKGCWKLFQPVCTKILTSTAINSNILKNRNPKNVDIL